MDALTIAGRRMTLALLAATLAVLTGSTAADFGFQRLGAGFDVGKSAQNTTAGIENRRARAPAGEGRFPGSQQGVVVRFHPLRGSRSAPKFATRFQK